MAAAFGSEPDVFDVFKTMLGEAGKRFNNPLRALALFGKAVRHIRGHGRGRSGLQ